METSFFSGSENLYKYLVTVGILLIVLTVYYPLKEKQELELLSIKTENELKILHYKIIENQKEVKSIKSFIKNTNPSEKNNILKHIREINRKNHINQISLESKALELKSRYFYIKIYSVLFFVFIPGGIYLVIFGFRKWNKTKKLDDKILKLEKKKLKIEVQNLENSNMLN